MPWPNHSTKHATIPPFSSTQIQKRFWRNAAPLETLCVVDRLVSDNRTDSLAWIRPPDWLPLLPIIHRFRHRLHPSPETFSSSRSRLPFSLSLAPLLSTRCAILSSKLRRVCPVSDRNFPSVIVRSCDPSSFLLSGFLSFLFFLVSVLLTGGGGKCESIRSRWILLNIYIYRGRLFERESGIWGMFRPWWVWLEEGLMEFLEFDGCFNFDMVIG